MRGLYAIVDLTSVLARGLDPLRFADALLGARPAALQLRAKEASDEVTLGLLKALAPKCRTAGVPLVANDRPDLALRAECDMLHVGQTDATIAQVRALSSSLPIGISTHSEAQLRTAIAASPRYVAFGPIFSTNTKADPDPEVGLVALESISRVRGEIPLVAIGGITLERARTVARFVDMVAVIGDLLPPSSDERAAYRWVTDRARSFQDVFSEVSR